MTEKFVCLYDAFWRFTLMTFASVTTHAQAHIHAHALAWCRILQLVVVVPDAKACACICVVTQANVFNVKRQKVIQTFRSLWCCCSSESVAIFVWLAFERFGCNLIVLFLVIAGKCVFQISSSNMAEDSVSSVLINNYGGKLITLLNKPNIEGYVSLQIE